MNKTIETREDLLAALDKFRDRYNEKFYNFEMAKLKLYSLIQSHEDLIDDDIHKRVSSFLEIIRRKGQIIEL